MKECNLICVISEPNGRLSEVLRQAVLSLRTKSYCDEKLKTNLHQSKICAGGVEARFLF